VDFFADDFSLALGEDDKIKDAFLLSSENGFVFPFIPFFDVNLREFFSLNGFKDRSFGFPPEHFIGGIEIYGHYGKINYGGKIYKTNTGINILPLFFGSDIKRTFYLQGERGLYVSSESFFSDIFSLIGYFKIERVFINLMKRGRVFVCEKGENILSSNLNFLLKLPFLIIKKYRRIFFFFDFEEDFDNFFALFGGEFLILELPRDSHRLIDFLFSDKKLKGFSILKKDEFAERLMIENQDFILSSIWGSIFLFEPEK
jgi:hypothetical protein